jgi:precorrin-6x reductase
VKRTDENISEYGRYFSDIDSLIDYLNTTDGSIFITTGSKELRSFCRLENFRERCTVRILPNENIIAECVDMGFDRAKIIAEKGAFTESRNILHLQKSGAEFLVTKDSGKVGGFDEKISAAKKCGVEVLIIMRPTEDGISLNAAKEILLSEKNHE